MKILLDDEADLDDLRAAFTVEVHEAGVRLDRLVVARLLGLDVGDVRIDGVEVFRRLAAEGRVRLDGRAIVVGAPRVAAGGRVVVLGPAARPAVLRERWPIPILFEDATVLVVDKPGGLPMTPGTGHRAGTLANALRGLGRPLSSLEGPLRPGIVHRLDRGTSGALVVAKDDETHRRLTGLFLAHAVERRYVALVHGHPAWASERVEAPLGRRRPGRKAHAPRPDGRPAVTHLAVRERLPGDVSLVEAVPETGRTHQIRVHLAAVGHPLVGDTLYGGGVGAWRRTAGRLGLRRPCLHAERLAIPGWFDVTAPWPDDLVEAVGHRSPGA